MLPTAITTDENSALAIAYSSININITQFTIDNDHTFRVVKKPLYYSGRLHDYNGCVAGLHLARPPSTSCQNYYYYSKWWDSGDAKTIKTLQGHFTEVNKIKIKWWCSTIIKFNRNSVDRRRSSVAAEMWSRTVEGRCSSHWRGQTIASPRCCHRKRTVASVERVIVGLDAACLDVHGTTTGDEADHHRAPSVFVKPSSSVLDLEHWYKFQECTKHHTHEKQHYIQY